MLLRKQLHFVFCFSLLFSLGSRAEQGPTCTQIFTLNAGLASLPQIRTVPTGDSQPARQLARLFLPKNRTASPEDFENRDRPLFNSDFVLREALAFRKQLNSIPRARWAHAVHIPFFERQLPQLLEMLDQLSTAQDSMPYQTVDAKGRLLSNFNTIGEARSYFKMQGQKALERKMVSMAFFTEFAIEILSMHYAVWKNFDFHEIQTYEKYQSFVQARGLRERKGGNRWDQSYDNSPDEVAISPMVSFLLKVAEVKSKIISQIEGGNIFWPTFAPLSSEDFADWHLGIKPVSISLRRVLTFDGAISDFFGLAVHDITNHTLPPKMHEYRDSFSNFKLQFFQKIERENSLHAEIMKKIWFKLTHETFSAIYSEYLFLKQNQGGARSSSARFRYNVGSSITRLDIPDLMTKEEYSPLTAELMSPLYFQGELSPALRHLTPAELEQSVKIAWTRFLTIFQEVVDQQFFESLPPPK